MRGTKTKNGKKWRDNYSNAAIKAKILNARTGDMQKKVKELKKALKKLDQ